MHANDYVTNSILRGEFGFGDGFIISDCNDIPALVSFRVAANLSHAGAKGIKGGVDLDLQCGDQAAYTHLAEAISEAAELLSTLEPVDGGLPTIEIVPPAKIAKPVWTIANVNTTRPP